MCCNPPSHVTCSIDAYLDDLLRNLPGFIDVQHVTSLSHHRVQSHSFAETADTHKQDGCYVRRCLADKTNRMAVASVAAPGDDSEVGRSHAGTHEQHHILVPGLSVVHHLLLEEFQVVLVVAVDLQQADGDLAVPAALVHLPPAALERHQGASSIQGFNCQMSR